MLASITLTVLVALMPIVGALGLWWVKRYISNKESAPVQNRKLDEKIEEILSKEHNEEELSMHTDSLLDDIDRLRRHQGEDINKRRKDFKIEDGTELH